MEETTVKKTRKKLSKEDIPSIDALINQTDPAQETVAPVVNEIISSFNPLHIKVLESSIQNATPALLIGHTGLGKTTLIKELAKKHNKNLVRISVHSGVTADEILGKWLAINGSTVWEDGILVKAMKNGEWVVFDEINACPADVMFAMHALLDDEKIVTLLEKNGEIVRPLDSFRFFATMNPPEDYAGTKEMNMAFMSRFNAVLFIEPFARDEEIKILERRGLPNVVSEKLVDLANTLREFKTKDEISYFCGTRDIINTGLLLGDGVALDTAITFGILNKVSPEDRAFLQSRNIGHNSKPAYQKELDSLKDSKKELERELATVKTNNAKIQKELEELKAKSKNAGNVNVDPKTMRALNLLKIVNNAPANPKTNEHPF